MFRLSDFASAGVHPYQSQFPPHRRIQLLPADPLASLGWETAADVIVYLLFSPISRDDLLEEIYRRSRGRKVCFLVTHPLLPIGFALDSQDNDYTFINILQFKLRLEWGQQANVDG